MIFVIVVLAIVGLASLLGVTVTSVFAVGGALVLIPILLFKIFLIVVLFGVFGRAFHRKAGSHRYRQRRSGWGRGPTAPPEPSPETRFEDWHRLAHAKDEVDGWVPEA